MFQECFSTWETTASQVKLDMVRTAIDDAKLFTHLGASQEEEWGGFARVSLAEEQTMGLLERFTKSEKLDMPKEDLREYILQEALDDHDGRVTFSRVQKAYGPN